MNATKFHWMNTLRSMRFMQLLFFSMGTMVLQAVIEQSVLLGLVLNLLYLNAMMVALSSSGAHRHIRNGLVVLWFLSFSLRFITVPGFEQELFIFSKCLGSLLLSICIVSMAHFMFFRRRVTVDTLFAGVVIYILIAILFAQLYSITENLLPGSFVYPPDLALDNGHLRDVSYSYFSFVTIATLGYGDIAPRHAVAQMLASIEAIIGQFYVAIVVARLMSLYAAARGKHE
jgi:voltage-gated potassium channel